MSQNPIESSGLTVVIVGRGGSVAAPVWLAEAGVVALTAWRISRRAVQNPLTSRWLSGNCSHGIFHSSKLDRRFFGCLWCFFTWTWSSNSITMKLSDPIPSNLSPGEVNYCKLTMASMCSAIFFGRAESLLTAIIFESSRLKESRDTLEWMRNMPNTLCGKCFHQRSNMSKLVHEAHWVILHWPSACVILFGYIWWLLNGAAPLQTLYLASALVACLDELHDPKGLLGHALQPRCGVRVWFLNMDTNGARFHALCGFCGVWFLCWKLQSCQYWPWSLHDPIKFESLPNISKLEMKNIILISWDLSLHPFSRDVWLDASGAMHFCLEKAAASLLKSRCMSTAKISETLRPVGLETPTEITQTPRNRIRSRQPVELKP